MFKFISIMASPTHIQKVGVWSPEQVAIMVNCMASYIVKGKDKIIFTS